MLEKVCTQPSGRYVWIGNQARLLVSDLVISDSVNASIYQALRSLASHPILDFVFQVKDYS